MSTGQKLSRPTVMIQIGGRLASRFSPRLMLGAR